MFGGYTGKILFVDLDSGSTKVESFSEADYRRFIGGAGLGARVLYEQVKPRAEPLGPENMLGFVTGLLTGSPVPMTPRSVVVTKSPLTGTWADSNVGGYFGRELKNAGYDAVFFRGTSARPVYLLIQDNRCELRDSSHLWGKDTTETQNGLRQELGDKAVRVACIGPAGESLSLLASVICGERVAARQGVGAVMGAKKLKAVAVRGTGKINIARPDEFSRLRKAWMKDLTKLDSMPFLRGLSTWGTCASLSALVISGAAPIKNWSLLGEESFPEHEKLSGDSVTHYQTQKYGCFGCPIACGGVVKVREGPYRVEATRKPEYETMVGLGPMCLNTDVESIIKAGDICDRYGLDTISVGEAIAFAMECYEKGLIGQKDTDGIELTWGNASAMVNLVEKMAKREGLGSLLADGVKRAAEGIGRGSEELAIHVHGQEPGYHDPRSHPLRGLGYFASPRPGRHGEGFASVRLDREQSLGPYPEIKAPEGGWPDQQKGKLHAIACSYLQTLSDCGVCQFALSSGSNFPLADFVATVTGWDFSPQEAITTGRRILTLRQLFNIRDGLTASDFRLPDRIARAPSTGPYAGRQIDFDSLRASYYTEMGWDVTTGRPYEACLNELGLEALRF